MIVFRLSSFWARLSFLCSRLKCFGLAICSPSLVHSRLEIPTSIPTFLSVGGNGRTVISSTNKQTNHLPEGSSLTVTVDGLTPWGKNLDQTIFNGSLDLASQSFPSFHLKAERVNSALPPDHFFLKLGYLARFAQKFSNALLKWRNVCWSGTQLTSLRKESSSSSFFQAVSIEEVWL